MKQQMGVHPRNYKSWLNEYMNAALDPERKGLRHIPPAENVFDTMKNEVEKRRIRQIYNEFKKIVDKS